MKSIKIILFTLFVFFSLENNLLAEIRYVDFKFVLNESKAGKGAQEFLKKTFDNDAKKFSNIEKSLKEEEKD